MTLLGDHVITSSLLYRVLISDTAIYLLHSQLSQHVGYKDQYHSIMIEGEDLLLCPTCGTQFDILAESPPSGYCRICDVSNQHGHHEENIDSWYQDPRQYIPATGQAWTSLKAEAGKHETKWKQDEQDKRVWSIWAEPKVCGYVSDRGGRGVEYAWKKDWASEDWALPCIAASWPIPLPLEQ